MSDKNPFFTIVCPTFNSEKTIARAIESVIKQNFNDYELLIVDDGSNDNTEEIVNRYKKLCNIKFNKKTHNGPFYSRVEGINNSLGKYLLFLDSDDCLSDDCLSCLYKKLEVNNFDFILFNEKHKYSTINNEKIFSNNCEIFQYCFADELHGYLWQYCFKNFKNQINYSLIDLNVRYTEDTYLVFLFLKQCNVGAAIPNNLYFHEINDSGICSKLSAFDYFCRFIIFDFIYSSSNLQNKNLSNQIKSYLSFIPLSYVRKGLMSDDKETFNLRILSIKKSYLFQSFTLSFSFKDKESKLLRKIVVTNSAFYKKLIKCYESH